MQRPPDAKRTHVEPAWDHIDEQAQRGRTEPLTVPYHSHTSTLSEQMAAETEAETALDLMQRMGVDCHNHGFHRHGPHFPTVTEGTVNPMLVSNWPPHHHHDMRCLVEAGANTVRPALKQAQQSRDTWHRLADTYERQRDEARQELAQTQGLAHRRYVEMVSMEQFMESMPAVGPWKHIWEQYQAWVEERREEEAANG